MKDLVRNFHRKPRKGNSVKRSGPFGEPPDSERSTFLRSFPTQRLGTPRPGTEVSRTLRDWNPKRDRKESERVSRGLWPWGAPESPKSAPRSPKRVQGESEATFLDSFRTPWHTLGLPGARGSRTPFRTLVHHNAATQNAAMHNASFSQRYPYPFFYSVIAVMPFPVFQHRP